MTQLSNEATLVNIDQLWEEANDIPNLETLKPELLAGAIDLKKVCIERGLNASLDNCIKVLHELDAIGIDFMTDEGKKLCKMALNDSRNTGLNPILCLKCENIIDLMYKKMGESYIKAVVVICNSIKDPVRKRARIKQSLKEMLVQINQ